MTPPFADELNLRLCHRCKYACSLDRDRHRCSRCNALLHRRKPDAIARTWALLLAAFVFYVPANVLPILRTTALQHDSTTTILGSVVDLWQDGAWDIAVIIFVASVVVPVAKFLILAFLLVTVQRRSRGSCRERTQLYRGLELIGYWSMLDVFVVGLLAALVQFGVLGDIEPRLGILFFGLVVVLTMMATLTFDSRLIWDAVKDER
ncbi:MAG: paraquat-inducible protein A [Oleiphilaceae bacterium]|nr:paraquat-inducible protein A [Oleiphilaceae bacterium]